MKNLFQIICFLTLLPVLATGQERERVSAGQGYVFGAPGAVLYSGGATGTIHFGGGGEFNIYRGLGFGAEIGYLSPFRSMNSGVGVLSANGLYSFAGNAKVIPFITGGYSLLFRSGHANAINFGGGFHYWFSRKTGLRIEFRDHIHPQYLGEHILEGRIGISFR